MEEAKNPTEKSSAQMAFKTMEQTIPRLVGQVEMLPDSFSKDMALVKLQECVWWVHKAIADKPKQESGDAGE